MANGFRVVTFEDHEAMSRHASAEMAAALAESPDLLLGAASGATPARAYDLAAADGRARAAASARLRILRRDEWGGLAGDDPGSSEAQIHRQLAAPLGVTADRYFAFRGD